MPINQPGTSTASQLDAPAASVVANATETVVPSSDSAVAEADGDEPTVLTTQSQQPVRVFSSRRMSLIFLSCQVCDPRANPGPILQDREMTANETRWLGRIEGSCYVQEGFQCKRNTGAEPCQHCCSVDHQAAYRKMLYIFEDGQEKGLYTPVNSTVKSCGWVHCAA